MAEGAGKKWGIAGNKLGVIIIAGIISVSCGGQAARVADLDTQGSFGRLPTPTITPPPPPKQSLANDSRVTSLYMAEPTDFGPESFVGSSIMAIFYSNGDFGTASAGLYREAGGVTLRAFFDEIVVFGKWKKAGDQMIIKIERCQCLHCFEERGNFSKKELKDPMPLTERWKIESDEFGKAGNVLGSSRFRFRPVHENEFVFGNYEEMIAEPLKLKNYRSKRSCFAGDFDGF